MVIMTLTKWLPIQSRYNYTTLILYLFKQPNILLLHIRDLRTRRD